MRPSALWAALGAALIASCAARPFRGDTGIRPFAFDLYDVHCPSGLRVIFERAPGTIAGGVTAVVSAGARQDPPGREGLAHLVEHLTFRAHGPGVDPLRIRLWAMGATYNAETDFDATTYHAFVPGESLRALLGAEGQRLLDPLAGVDDATFAVERDVVRNELRERNETHVFGAAFQAAYQAAFPPDHPYSRAVGGSHESLSALTLDDARSFVARYYRPQDITLVVVGDMELTAVEGFVRAALPPALYGDAAHPVPIGTPPPAATSVPSPPPPPPGLARRRAPVPTPELWIAWPLPGGFGADRRMAEMWAGLATQNFFMGRLDDNDVAEVTLFAEPNVLASLLICRVQLSEGSHPEESLRQVVAALPWIVDDDLWAEYRFRFLKLARLRHLAFQAESLANRGRERADYARWNGSLGAYGGMVDAVKSISVDGARAYAQKYLGRDRARAVLVEPLAADARPATAVPAAQDLATVAFHTPLSEATLARLRGVRHLQGLRLSKLDNGLELAVLRRVGAPVFTASLAFHGGQSSAPIGVAAAAREALDLSVEESPGDYGIALYTSLDDDSFSTTVQAGTGNFARAMDMLAFATRSLDLDWPSDKFRDTKLPFLRRKDATPSERGDRAFNAALYGAHPIGYIPTAEQIAAPRKAELARWIDRTVTPANAMLVVVGDIDPTEAEAAARDAFGGWHASGGPVPPLAPAQPAATPGAAPHDWARRALVTHRPGATQADFELGCLLPPADGRASAVYDVTAALAKGHLEEKLREETGSTYGVHVRQGTARGGTSALRISANVDNGRLPLALATLRGFWRDVVQSGVDESDVRHSRDRQAIDHLLAFETSSDLAGALVAAWNLGWPLTWVDDQPAALAGVRKADVDATLAACARNLVVAITGDERVIRAALAQPYGDAAAAPPGNDAGDAPSVKKNDVP